MNSHFHFILKHKARSSRARTGMIHTPHGDIETPAFVPVGTQGSVKSMTPDDLDALHTQIYFVNTYHMYLRPGMEVIQSFGGLHTFMNWHHPIITDSGGFQVFSLATPKFGAGETPDGTRQPLVRISEDSVEFKSHWDGSMHTFTPESSMRHQWDLGSDIHIAFDDCTPYPVSHESAEASMQRTHRWAVRSLSQHKTCAADAASDSRPYQALYGSIQGSIFEDLRRQSTGFISSMDFDGFAIGGVSVGESKQEMAAVLAWVLPGLPDRKPRHLLGVGEIDDIFTLVEAGVDTFDCVQPTRLARMGWLIIHDPGQRAAQKHILDITKSQYAGSGDPVDQSCACYTCTNFSRGYIRHLFHVRELLAYRLATLHNLHVMHTLAADIRRAIADDSLLDLKRKWL